MVISDSLLFVKFLCVFYRITFIFIVLLPLKNILEMGEVNSFNDFHKNYTTSKFSTIFHTANFWFVFLEQFLTARCENFPHLGIYSLLLLQRFRDCINEFHTYRSMKILIRMDLEVYARQFDEGVIHASRHFVPPYTRYHGTKPFHVHFSSHFSHSKRSCPHTRWL